MTTTRTTEISAPAEVVWALISDLPSMGRISPENTGGAWKGGATGPAVGARFKGKNANGRRRWSTNVTVTACEPGKAFAIAISYAGIPVSSWTYALTSDSATSCTVVESWEDRRPGWFKAPAALTTGVKDRGDAFVGRNIETSLAALKALAEA